MIINANHYTNVMDRACYTDGFLIEAWYIKLHERLNDNVWGWSFQVTILAVLGLAW
jgi:hypothetical protein